MRTDLLLDSDGDLPIDAPGLMPVGFSDYQHQVDMFAAFPGEWKQFIFNGIGTDRYLKSTGNKLAAFKRNARQQLANDGYGNISQINAAFNAEGKLVINLTTTV